MVMNEINNMSFLTADSKSKMTKVSSAAFITFGLIHYNMSH